MSLPLIEKRIIHLHFTCREALSTQDITGNRMKPCMNQLFFMDFQINRSRLFIGFLFFVWSFVLNAAEPERPLILVTADERANVLKKIETQAWAKSIYGNFIERIDRHVAKHEGNPEAFLKQFPFDWSQSERDEIPPFYLTQHLENGVLENLDNATEEEWSHAAKLIEILQLGVDCGMAYYVTQDEKYAQCATDILHSFVQAVLQSEVSDWRWRGGLLFPEDGFREVRVIGSRVPLIYDFIAEYLKEGAKVYDIGKKEYVEFSFCDAQQVFRIYADLSINYGHTGSNHPVLEAPSLVYNALAMDNEDERNELLSYFLTENTENQDALNVMSASYAEKGDIWPETSQYFSHVASNLTRLMLIVNRYDPSLRLGAKYPNILMALPALDDMVYPNGDIVRWGDGKRRGHPPYKSYEDAYLLASMDGLDEVKNEFASRINRALKEGKYERRGMESIFWYDSDLVGHLESLALTRTGQVKHAGIFLQRNLSTTQHPDDGLMCFVGGAHMVHGHAEGMNIELFGEGEVLGVDNGRGSYQKDIHENYSRIFAAHNTVIVNGSSQGESGWVNLGINSVQLISMEPLVGDEGVSPDHSFTQTSFVDDRGEKAEAVQERTLGLIRTSPTTGYYVDVFRSKSRLPNEYHDYLYHNIGDDLTFQNSDLDLRATPERYMANADAPWMRNEQYRNPGWHFFEDVETSATFEGDVRAQFAVRQLHEKQVFMNVFIPGMKDREYSRVNAPHTFEAPEPYNHLPTPTLVIRKNGQAWSQPFVVVYEPFSEKDGGPSVLSVEALRENGIYRGLKITSEIGNDNLVQYVITQSLNESYLDEQLGIQFLGSYAVITCDGKGDLKSLYIGEGESLGYGEVVLQSNGQKCAYATY